MQGAVDPVAFGKEDIGEKHNVGFRRYFRDEGRVGFDSGVLRDVEGAVGAPGFGGR